MTSINDCRPSGTSPAQGATPVVPTVRHHPVRLPTLEALARDLDALEEAHARGTLRRLGNHEAGPIFDHLALAMARSFDGFPVVAAWWLRLLGPWIKRRVLSRPFRPGFKLSAPIERMVWRDSVSFDDGIRSLREQVARAREPGAAPAQAHPIFGRMSPAEWNTYHLRHAELHLNFLTIDA